LTIAHRQIIGNSARIRLMREMVARVAKTTATVLICGESGTGKELVARAIHDGSPRANCAFVPINCAAIPRDLLESELFGHRKGAFSGAIADRKGRFELAHGGTLFLDEIGDMPMDMQVKLLRVLQEGVIDPVGTAGQIEVDVRVVAATHRDLEAECAAGRFREDLFFRLNVLPLKVPPLRERAEDIQTLLDHFAVLHAVDGARPVAFASCLGAALLGYAWPGNIRELSNLVYRLSVLYSGQRLRLRSVPRDLLPSKMALENLPDEETGADAVENAGAELLFGTPAELPACEGLGRNPVEDIICVANGGSLLPREGLALKEYLGDIEKNIIEEALCRTGGNVSKTAELLQLQRTTLIQKMNKLKKIAGGASSANN
jgi:sigma-54 specific flagellar transcriptional regulator A